MALYVTGDKHARMSELINFINRFELNENDAIVVCGDMGLYFDDMEWTNSFLNYYENHYKTMIYWVPGNHENYNDIEKLPIDENDYKICSPHIKMMQRGHIYNIMGKKCLAIGGADSIDRAWRVRDVSWWEQERIRPEDVEGIPAGYYDFVFTHCIYTNLLKEHYYDLVKVLPEFDNAIFHYSEDELQKVKDKIEYGHWYFGHYHNDIQLNDKDTCLYHDFIKIID